MVEFFAVLEYQLDAPSPFDLISKPAVMEQYVLDHRAPPQIRLPKKTLTSATAPRRRIALYELDSSDDPNSFISAIHQAIHGALGQPCSMSHVPPDAFVRVFFIPGRDSADGTRLWEWRRDEQKLVQQV